MNAALHAMLRIAVWTLALALVAMPVVAVLNGWIGTDRWPLRTLRLGGELKRVDPQQLRALVLPYARKGFFAVDLAQAQAAVAKLPWVEHAEVRKRWPDVLEVRVVEYQPFARWGRDRLLSEHGHLFPIGKLQVPDSLPQFDVDAPASRSREVVALYNEASELFAPEGRAVRRVTLDRRGSWSLTLSNGTDVVIGSQEGRLRLARFARLLPRLLTQKPLPLVRADLRYTNGFALTWADEAGPLTAGKGLGDDIDNAQSAKDAKSADARHGGMADRPQSVPSVRDLPPLSFASLASFAEHLFAPRVPGPESPFPSSLSQAFPS